MHDNDRALGMDAPITRRDFVHGAAKVGLGAAAVGALAGCERTIEPSYPPALTGMRGNHDGAFEVAHALAREGQSDWGPVQELGESFDLVVVGAGLSGLAAAHFYRRQRPDARILILDNHDDFGGHAKRNEHDVQGGRLIDYGGSAFLVAPYGYSAIVKGLMADLKVDFEQLGKVFDYGFYERHGLKAGLHFSQESWGEDRFVPFEKVFLARLPCASAGLTIAQSVGQMPISKAAQDEFLQLLTDREDRLAHIAAAEKVAYLQSISYRQFLEDHLGVTEPEIFAVLQDMANDPGLGIEAADAYLAMTYHDLPGWDAAGLPPKEMKPYKTHRFPDGNASIARLMVRHLIPGIAPGNSMADIVTARFDYGKLDQPSSNIRIRLRSTAINVQEDDKVHVTYVQDGKAARIAAKDCILACNNAIIPYICPGVPEDQAEALTEQVRQPILMTSVAVRNWQAWKKLGIGAVLSPGSYHIGARLGFPLSLGSYRYSADPSQPTNVTMYRYAHINNQGLTPKEQYRAARAELLATSFADIERSIRQQLGSLLGAGGFDPATDITGITVNRWAHGYAYDLSSHLLFDTLYEDPDDPRYAHVRGRQPFGRITIANSDAGASAMLESAVEQAHRAVQELL